MPPSSKDGAFSTMASSSSSGESLDPMSPLRRYISNGHGTMRPQAVKEGAKDSTPLLKQLPQINVVPNPLLPLLFDASEINSRDAQSPLVLFFQDAAVFCHIMAMLPYATLPANARDDGDAALVNSARGRRDQALITAVSVAQALLMPAALLGWLVLPASAFVLIGAATAGLMGLMLKVTQGPRFVHSRREEGAGEDPFPRERWVFINGIMTGYVGLQSAVDGLSRVFKRPVLGIHNETSGFFGDIFECLLQRCFSYCTKDVRVSYERLYRILLDKDVDKVVLVAHSQGGIIASLCIDYLFTKLPEECMAKLEVYTFGSAASHFNNPTHGPIAPRPGAASPAEPAPPASPHALTVPLSGPSCPEHVIKHMEHYANSMDPIPRWGVLHSVYALLSRRYAGTLFVRLGASGHYFTSHYLAAWFPADAAEAALLGGQKVGLEAAVVRKRDVRESRKPEAHEDVGGAVGEGDFDGEGPARDDLVARADTMEWGDDRPAGMRLLDDVERARKALQEGQLNFVAGGHGYEASMRELSRLWRYTDGGCPDD